MDAEWNVVANSIDEADGDNRDPVFFDDLDQRTSAFRGRGEQSGRTCWAIDVESVYPGMARIKMALDDGGRSEGSPILKHDFLVIWLDMSNPDLTELSDASFPGYDVGDPTGNGDFLPIDGDYLNGLARVTVTGSFTDLHGTARTLPADWAALAARYAADTDGRNPARWDIHDDQSEREGHTLTSMCGRMTKSIDAVDNCLGGNEIGPFSRRWAARSSPSVRSIPSGRAARSFRMASSTRVTRRCRPPGSTSRSPAPSARLRKRTSTSSTAGIARVRPPRPTRTTRTTCTRRSTRL